MKSEASREVESWLREIARVPAADPNAHEETLPDSSDSSAGPADRTPQPGDVLEGRYRLDEVLGEGGMGVVFTATQLATGKLVAVKCMRPRKRSAEDQRRAVERFIREARATARIEHPNVVDVYDVGGTLEGPYLVMERLRGETLGQRLDRAPLSWDEAVSLLEPVMHALSMAHGAGVVHRDLKPDNLFLAELPGGARVVKVLDFGISQLRSADDGDAQQSLTRTGAILGTPLYMPLEQLRPEGELDGRTDVFSLGVVLYEALTQQRPYPARTIVEYGAVLASEPPLPLARLRPDLAGARAAVVMRAVARDRSDRFPDMEAFRQAFLSAAHGEVLEAKPEAAPPARPGARARDVSTSSLPDEARPRRRLSWLLAALLLVGAVLGAWAATRLSSPRGPTFRAEPVKAWAPENFVLDAALSPDGKWVALSDPRGFFVADVASGSERLVDVPGRPACVEWLSQEELVVTFSPVGFGVTDLQPYSVARLDLRTGAVRTLAHRSGNACPRLSPDRKELLTTRPDGLYTGPLESATQRKVFALAAEEWPLHTAWSPDGQYVALLVMSALSDPRSARVEVVDVHSGAHHVAVRSPELLGVSFASIVGFDGSGRLLFGRSRWRADDTGNGLFALRLDHGKPVGEPELVVPSDGSFAGMHAAESGSTVALVQRNQIDVYVADLAPDGSFQGSPRRLTVSAGVERVSDIGDDGRVLISASDGHSFAPFRVDRVTGAKERLSPPGRAGSWPIRWGSGDVVYVDLEAAQGKDRAPISFVQASAPQRSLYRSRRSVAMRTLPGLVPPDEVRLRCTSEECVLIEHESARLVLSSVDRASFAVKPLVTLELPSRETFDLAVSRDGERFAVSPRLGAHHLFVYDRGGKLLAEHQLPDHCIAQSAAFTADHDVLYVSGICGGPIYKLFLLDRSGAARVVHASTEAWLHTPVVAPDGSFVAFVRQSMERELLLLHEQ